MEADVDGLPVVDDLDQEPRWPGTSRRPPISMVASRAEMLAGRAGWYSQVASAAGPARTHRSVTARSSGSPSAVTHSACSARWPSPSSQASRGSTALTCRVISSTRSGRGPPGMAAWMRGRAVPHQDQNDWIAAVVEATTTASFHRPAPRSGRTLPRGPVATGRSGLQDPLEVGDPFPPPGLEPVGGGGVGMRSWVRATWLLAWPRAVKAMTRRVDPSSQLARIDLPGRAVRTSKAAPGSQRSRRSGSAKAWYRRSTGTATVLEAFTSYRPPRRWPGSRRPRACS